MGRGGPAHKFPTNWACLLDQSRNRLRLRTRRRPRPTWILEGNPNEEGILALAAAATIAAGTLSAPTPADARCYGCGVGAGVAAGLIGGAIIGGAIANSQPRYYAPAPGYVVYDGYGAPYPAAARVATGRAGRLYDR